MPGRGPRVQQTRPAQLAPGSHGVAGGVQLGSQGEGSRHPTDEVGADRVTPGRGPEDGPVRDEPVGMPSVPIVGLGQPPTVVVAAERPRPVARADPDLQEQGPVLRVPHLGQPRQPDPGLGDQPSRRARAQEARAAEQQHVVVGRRVGELQVVAGVEPTARDVHRPTDPVQAPVEDQVRAALHPGPPVEERPPVVEMRRPAVEGTGDDVCAVALVPVEGHAGAQDPAEDVAGPAYPEPGGAGGDLSGRLDAVATGSVQPAQFQSVHRGEACVPRPGRARGHATTQNDVPRVVGDAVPGVLDRRGGHQPRLLGLAGQIALLVDPDQSVGRAGCRHGPRQGRSGSGAGHEPPGEQGGQRRAERSDGCSPHLRHHIEQESFLIACTRSRTRRKPLGRRLTR